MALIDVCMITYNHALFIESAIQGVICQTFDDFRIIICDDHSTDGTTEICMRYANKYPDIIKLDVSDRNIGMMPNFIKCLGYANAPFVAICEGDDVWTDPDKLKLQYSFIIERPQCSVVFHNASIIDEQGRNTGQLFGKYKKQTYCGGELLKRWLIPTASALVKNVALNSLPPYFNMSTHGDLSLFLYLSLHGNLCYINRVMSAYRIHQDGVTMQSFRGINHNLEHIRQCEEMLEFFPKKIRKLLQKRIIEYKLVTAYLLAEQRRKKEAKSMLLTSIKMLFRFNVNNIKYYIATVYYLIFK